MSLLFLILFFLYFIFQGSEYWTDCLGTEINFSTIELPSLNQRWGHNHSGMVEVFDLYCLFFNDVDGVFSSKNEIRESQNDEELIK